MASAVDYAINEVMNADIDDYLFNLAFTDKPNRHWSGNWFDMVGQTTVPQGIREKVIHRTVLPACSMAGGKTDFIDLTGSSYRDRGNGCIEVSVPDSVTRGAKIVSVTEVYLGSMASATGGFYGGLANDDLCGNGVVNEMTGTLLSSMQGNSKMPVTFTDCPMTGNNMFAINGLNKGNYSLTARVILEYDAGMSSISPRHFDEFAELVLWATKAFIYRNCRRPSQEGIMRAGISMDMLSNDLDKFSDAYQTYKDKFKEFKSCLTNSDRTLRRDAIHQQVTRRM